MHTQVLHYVCELGNVEDALIYTTASSTYNIHTTFRYNNASRLACKSAKVPNEYYSVPHDLSCLKINSRPLSVSLTYRLFLLSTARPPGEPNSGGWTDSLRLFI